MEFKEFIRFKEKKELEIDKESSLTPDRVDIGMIEVTNVGDPNHKYMVNNVRLAMRF